MQEMKRHIQDFSSTTTARRIQHRDAYFGQLMALLPESPSPICSHCTTTHTSSRNSEVFYSEIASGFPSSRNQSFGSCCNENEDHNWSSCFCEIDEWLENANKFCILSNFQTKYCSSDDEKLSTSSICKTFLEAPEHELYSITLPSVKEQSTVYESHSRLACMNSIYGASKSGGIERDHARKKLLSRPKPYNAFLNEVEMQKLEAERDSWKRAKHVKLMDRMRIKEAAIDDLELEQTRIVMGKMKKLQNKLEMTQLKVSAMTQKKICMINQKAEKKKKNLRRRTIEKISAASNVSETRTCRGFMCLC